MAETYEIWPAGATATMDVTYKQANAAGGSVVCEITPGFGQEFILMGYRAINSGTNGASIQVETAAGGTNLIIIASVGSGAGATADGGIGLVSTTMTTGAPVGIGWPLIVSGLQTLRIQQTGAGAQNDTFRILINVRVRLESMPTVIHSNSTNPGDVTVTAGSEIFTVV